jgi:hypothetical protein
MPETVIRRRITLLMLGDFIALALITIIGFARHGEIYSAGARIFTTFIPLILGWLAVAPLMGAYQLEFIKAPDQLWRPFWAMVVGAPLAAWLRGIWLQSVIIPVFVLVLGGVAALSILLWRSVYYLLFVRRSSPDG